MLLLFARLVMPVTVLGSAQLFQHFLQQPYEQSQLASETATGKLQEMQPDTPAPDALPAPEGDATSPGWLDRLNHWSNSARLAASAPIRTAQDKLTQLAGTLDQLVQQLVTLIVVFALQTIVLPLPLAWALLQLCKGLVQTQPAA